MTQVVKNLPEMQETLYNSGDAVSFPESERSPGEGNDIPLQYSYLENSLD